MADRLSYESYITSRSSDTGEVKVHFGPEGDEYDPEIGWLERFIEEHGDAPVRKKTLWLYRELAENAKAAYGERVPLSPGESESMAFLSLRDAKKWLAQRVEGGSAPFPTYAEWVSSRKANPVPVAPWTPGCIPRLRF